MKKRLGFIVVLIGLTAALSLFLYDNNHGFVEVETTKLDRTKINNLRAINPETNMTYAQMLVNEIPQYKTNIKSFALQNEYPPDYFLTRIDVREDVAKGIELTDAMYTSTGNDGKIIVTLFSFKSAKDAQLEWINSLETYSIGIVPVSEANGIILGDIAIAFTERDVNYIRGNIQVYLSGLSGNSTIKVAKEIDEQIIKALEEAEG